MAQHARLHIDTGLDVYLCDPQSPWQRGRNENTNCLLRQYFPKGTDLSSYSSDELDAITHAINTRPHKIGRAPVCTPVTYAYLVCRLLRETPKNTYLTKFS